MKVLLIEKENVWVALFRGKFDQRPTAEQASQLTTYVPAPIPFDLWGKRHPQLLGQVPTTEMELQDVEKARKGIYKHLDKQ
jgi:hypothetical protein